MGFLDNIKAFVHSITTDDHYASYGSDFNTSRNKNTGNIIGSNHGSSSRLNELQNNGSQQSFDRSSTPVGYRPGLRSSSSNMNLSTDLPMQNFNGQGLPPLPTIDSLWDRIEKWMEEEYPELEDNLNDGVTTADLNEFENDLAVGKLPTEFRQFYKRHDGQLRGGRPTGVIMGMALLDLEGIYEEYTVWSKVAERLERTGQSNQTREGNSRNLKSGNNHNNNHNNNFMANQRSIPPNSIQPYYYYRGWIPILKDHIGNQIAIDLAPGPNGQWGQIIIYGRDFDTKLVIASSFQEFIWIFVGDLENGNYQIDSNQINEELGYLSESRNDDYMIGDEDEDQGELCFYDRDNKEFGGSIKGRLSYIEILKRRALKKYGLTENYQTMFTPKVNKKEHHSPVPIIISSSSKGNDVNLPKETLIDNKKEEKNTTNTSETTKKDDSKLTDKLDKLDIINDNQDSNASDTTIKHESEQELKGVKQSSNGKDSQQDSESGSKQIKQDEKIESQDSIDDLKDVAL